MDTSFLIGPVEQPLLLHNHTHNKHHILHQEEEMLVTLNNQMNCLFALLTLMLKNVIYLAMGKKNRICSYTHTLSCLTSSFGTFKLS